MRPNETLSEVCEEFSPRFTGAFHRSGLTRFAWPRPKRPIDGVRIDIVIAIMDTSTLDIDADLPPELWLAPPKFRDTYLVFRELWGKQVAALTEDPRVMVADILTDLQAVFDKRGEGAGLPPAKWDEAKRSTVTHGMSFLQELDLVRAHPVEQGWIDGGKQLRLSEVLKPARSEEKRSAQAVGSVADIAHTSRVGHDSRAHSRGLEMKRYIWVPIDIEEGKVIDACDEGRHDPSDRTDEMSYCNRMGRKQRPKATRAELLRTEGKFAVVRLNRKEVCVLILGDWHLAGQLSDAEPELAEATASN